MLNAFIIEELAISIFIILSSSSLNSVIILLATFLYHISLSLFYSKKYLINIHNMCKMLHPHQEHLYILNMMDILQFADVDLGKMNVG